MKRSTILITVIALLFVIFIIIASRPTSNGPAPLSNLPILQPSTNQVTDIADPEGWESDDPAERGQLKQELQQRLVDHPWSAELPTFTDRYEIYYTGSPVGVEIKIKANNTNEQAQYLNEALQWLKDRSADTNSISIDVKQS